MFIDLSKFKKPSNIKFISKPNWLIIVDKAIDYKISTFHKTKNEIVEPVCG